QSCTTAGSKSGGSGENPLTTTNASVRNSREARMRVTSSRSSSSIDPVRTRMFANRTVPSKDSFQVLQLAAESLPHGMLVVNPDGAIVLANQQIERQFGYCRNELVGLPVDMLLPDA